MHPAESENDTLMDGQTERQMDERTNIFFLNGGYNIIPHTLQSGGVYKQIRIKESKGAKIRK